MIMFKADKRIRRVEAYKMIRERFGIRLPQMFERKFTGLRTQVLKIGKKRLILTRKEKLKKNRMPKFRDADFAEYYIQEEV